VQNGKRSALELVRQICQGAPAAEEDLGIAQAIRQQTFVRVTAGRRLARALGCCLQAPEQRAHTFRQPLPLKSLGLVGFLRRRQRPRGNVLDVVDDLVAADNVTRGGEGEVFVPSNIVAGYTTADGRERLIGRVSCFFRHA
jgi:hypothetical protein